MSPSLRMILSCTLACTLALASDCSTSACAQSEDETNLMQVYQTFSKGRDRVAKTEEKQPDDDEESSGDVNDAFENHRREAKDSLPKAVQDGIDFAHEVKEQRKGIANQAHEFGEAQKQHLADSLENDRDNVEAVAENRKRVMDDADDAVNDAKANWQASEVAKRQVQNAAVAGHAEGVREGDTVASGIIADDKIGEAQKHADDVEQAKIDADEQHAQSVREGVNQETQKQTDAEKAWESHVENGVDNTEQAADDKAHAIEEHIEGPDGVKNTIDKSAADNEAHPYEWAASHNSEATRRISGSE